MDATYSLRQSAQHPDLWLVDEHFGQHVEPLCGWTTKAKAEALQAKLNAAAARRAAPMQTPSDRAIQATDAILASAEADLRKLAESAHESATRTMANARAESVAKLRREGK